MLQTSAERLMPRFAAPLIALAALLAGCGGGGGGTSTSVAIASSRALAPVIPRAQSARESGNVLPITVGRANKVNLPMASVTVCIPGTSECQTIDNVLVDTGSVGLRI